MPASSAGRPYNNDATALPNGGHPNPTVVADDHNFVEHLGNAGRPQATDSRPDTMDTMVSPTCPKNPLDSRLHTGNAPPEARRSPILERTDAEIIGARGGEPPTHGLSQPIQNIAELLRYAVDIVLPLCYSWIMAVRKKRSVSIPPDLDAQIEAAAAEAGVTYSAWLAATARKEFTIRAGLNAVAEFEREQGAFSPDEIAEAEQWAREALERAANGRSRRKRTA